MDGWEDVSNNSIYVVIAITSQTMDLGHTTLYRKKNYNDIRLDIAHLAKGWKFTKMDTISLLAELNDYINRSGVFTNNSNRDFAIDLWHLLLGDFDMYFDFAKYQLESSPNVTKAAVEKEVEITDEED
ncbi:hypothetical protein AXG93_1099s1070 [Marchantia polymorpha subsp. ruderalis]|uniref:Uncharacterized protein n=1 Tax=Marchantia polymorpha subsp. ruderalis TaxID=1480154 RepID=A0A176WM67_MARPO|nr:hypothetical protein AXG93_1099s1070 [Marchantia polymorpha subsp. ruderalis]